MSRVVGLDISLNAAALAVGNGDPRKKLGQGLEGEAATFRVGEDTIGPRRLAMVTDSMMSWLSSRGVVTPGRLYVTEGYGFASQVASSLGEIGGCIRSAIWRTGGNLIVVPPATLKKWTAGKGNSVKGVMIKVVYKRWGFDSDDDNECDAWAASMLGLVDAGGPEQMTAIEIVTLGQKVERYAGKNQEAWLGGNPEGRLSKRSNRRAAGHALQ